MISPIHQQSRRNAHQKARGFSLIELLTVTAIVALLMTMATNIMRLDKQRSDVNEAIDNLGGLLRNARWEARSKSTYVWLCLKPGNYGGEEGVRVALFASRDGTSNSVPSNLTQVGQALTLKRISLGEITGATPDRLLGDYGVSSVTPASTERLGGSSVSITDGNQNVFSDSIVCFNPRGEASVPGKTGPSFIEVLIRPRMSGEAADAKASTILVSRATGASQIYR